MLNHYKNRLLTSSIITFIFFTLAASLSVIIYSLSNLVMKDILLVLGLITFTLGSLAAMEDGTSNPIISPYIFLQPLSNHNEEITKEDLEIESNSGHYLYHAIHSLKKSDIEFALSGLILILMSFM